MVIWGKCGPEKMLACQRESKAPKVSGAGRMRGNAGGGRCSYRALWPTLMIFSFYTECVERGFGAEEYHRRTHFKRIIQLPWRKQMVERQQWIERERPATKTNRNRRHRWWGAGRAYAHYLDSR